MRIYLAARYSRAEEMRKYRRVLETMGHSVTSRWIDQPHGGNSDKIRGEQDVAEQAAIEDMEDLIKADMVLSFAGNGDSTKKKASKGGRHVEFGAGLALNKMSVVVGEPEHAFHWLPNIERYSSFEEFADAIASDS